MAPDAPWGSTVEAPVTPDDADFQAWKAEKAAKEEAAAALRQEALDARAAESQAVKARRAEDAALCPNCDAERNNPSRAGHPLQEYLPHCWRCGFGSVAGQEYPAVTEAA